MQTIKAMVTPLLRDFLGGAKGEGGDEGKEGDSTRVGSGGVSRRGTCAGFRGAMYPASPFPPEAGVNAEEAEVARWARWEGIPGNGLAG